MNTRRGMLQYAIAIPVFCTLAGLAAVGCSSEKSSGVATTTSGLEPQSAPPTVQETVTSTEAPAPTLRPTPTVAVTWKFTDDDGWEYGGVVQAPRPVFKWSKDVSHSPPGMARLLVSYDGLLQPSPNSQVVPTNPGRSGPPRTLTPLSISFELPASLDSIGLGSSLHSTDTEEQPPCDLDGGSVPLDYAVSCNAYADAAGKLSGGIFASPVTASPTDALGYDVPEDALDTALPALNGSKPWVELDMWFQFPACQSYLTPDDSIWQHPDFGKGNCPFQVTM